MTGILGQRLPDTVDSEATKDALTGLIQVTAQASVAAVFIFLHVRVGKSGRWASCKLIAGSLQNTHRKLHKT